MNIKYLLKTFGSILNIYLAPIDLSEINPYYESNLTDEEELESDIKVCIEDFKNYGKA